MAIRTRRGILNNEEAGNLLNLINRYRAKTAVVALPVSGWAESGGAYTQTVAVAAIPESCVLHAGPAEAGREEYAACDVHVSAAAGGSVTFTAAGLPAADLIANLSVAEVG